MKPPTQRRLLNFLNILDWSGHIEIGDCDKNWLAGELAVFLSGGDEAMCEVCELVKPIVISTPLGSVCDDCIDGMSDEAEAIRDSFDGGDDD